MLSKLLIVPLTIFFVAGLFLVIFEFYLNSIGPDRWEIRSTNNLLSYLNIDGKLTYHGINKMYIGLGISLMIFSIVSWLIFFNRPRRKLPRYYKPILS